VKTSFGFHIIKVVDKKAASTRTLDEVRPMIAEQIKMQKAQEEAASLTAQIASEVKQPADLDKVAKARGLSVGDSGLFARDEPLAGLGFQPSIAAEAFSMEKDKVSGQVPTNQGYAFIALTDIQAPRVPTLDEVKDKVRDDVVKQKALELARAKAATVAQAGAKGNFAAAAKAAGVTVKNTDFVPRGTALPDVGVSGKVDDAVFGLKAGEVSSPIATDNAIVVARVVERQDVKPEMLDTEREALRNELLQERRDTFFQAYMAKAKAKFDIRYNESTIRTLLGS
jgi:peptidyl-prolyl cis-trans isomerase D